MQLREELPLLDHILLDQVFKDVLRGPRVEALPRQLVEDDAFQPVPSSMVAESDRRLQHPPQRYAGNIIASWYPALSLSLPVLPRTLPLPCQPLRLCLFQIHLPQTASVAVEK